jgi:hypothetical protein
MGTHYATAIVEEMGERIDAYIVAAPSSIKPGRLIEFFGKNWLGNKLLERLALSEKALINLLNLLKFSRLIDQAGRDILYKEIGTVQLRFNLYACLTYLRFLKTDEPELIRSITENGIKSIFIFGRRDKAYPPKIGKAFFKKLKSAVEVIVLDENHEMITPAFASALSVLLL